MTRHAKTAGTTSPRPGRVWMYSVVVPTFNRARNLGVTLESLLAQDTSVPYEVIVVDNNSSDETRAVASSFAEQARGRLHYIFEGKQGLSLARNAGIASAKGDIIAFVDDDIIASRTWLEAFARAYRAHPDAWCMGGKIVAKLPLAYPSWFECGSQYLRAYLSELDLGDATFRVDDPLRILGANFSVRRHAFSRVGAFRTDLGRLQSRLLSGEETDLCLRIRHAGGAMYYCGEAVLVHLVPPSRMARTFFRQRAYWQGRTAALLFPRDARRPRWEEVVGLGSNVIKDLAWMLASYCTGNIRQAFVHEVTAWLWWGKLCQTIVPEVGTRSH